MSGWPFCIFKGVWRNIVCGFHGLFKMERCFGNFLGFNVYVNHAHKYNGGLGFYDLVHAIDEIANF